MKTKFFFKAIEFASVAAADSTDSNKEAKSVNFIYQPKRSPVSQYNSKIISIAPNKK
ncbi:hypothetical protein PC116_g5031 [Phytophthora cactorum]|nr:hypothetical protein PC116_g5031 [Phytophthora cactorum]